MFTNIACLNIYAGPCENAIARAEVVSFMFASRALERGEEVSKIPKCRGAEVSNFFKYKVQNIDETHKNQQKAKSTLKKSSENIDENQN